MPKATSSTGVQGETAIAPIAKPIEELLNNLHETINNVMQLGHARTDINFTENLKYYKTYTLNNCIVVTLYYTRCCVQLCYNTDLRAWNVYTLATAELITPYTTSILQQAQYMYVVGNSLYIKQYDPTVCAAYQYLDTGNREINTELKKRFREVQLKFKPKDLTDAQVCTGFYIDGSSRTSAETYNVRTTTIDSENVIIVEPNLQGLDVFPTTELGKWTLGQSAFPGNTLCKVRIPVVGKGYTTRLVFISKAEKDFELFGYSWVYRTMNAR